MIEKKSSLNHNRLIPSNNLVDKAINPIKKNTQAKLLWLWKNKPKNIETTTVTKRAIMPDP